MVWNYMVKYMIDYIRNYEIINFVKIQNDDNISQWTNQDIQTSKKTDLANQIFRKSLRNEMHEKKKKRTGREHWIWLSFNKKYNLFLLVYKKFSIKKINYPRRGIKGDQYCCKKIWLTQKIIVGDMQLHWSKKQIYELWFASSFFFIKYKK